VTQEKNKMIMKKVAMKMESVVQAPRDTEKAAGWRWKREGSWWRRGGRPKEKQFSLFMKNAPCVLWMRFSLFLAFSSVCVCLFVCL